ncbi:HlyD family efflux transporter periplasmic adaptor subunit [Candidatus Cyanaurora vandensis]|uniref:HlyD family efflux transporter periplasmic adaptor subunit n=1 Tax=Candidatus Cyanaurora vandensis TaxID=2714958 RepID=UPI00257B61CF|nr:HlyD family efflux transporter periplasmic adaptor subunit [Candidatus Cyanaurora vandensis]
MAVSWSSGGPRFLLAGLALVGGFLIVRAAGVDSNNPPPVQPTPVVLDRVAALGRLEPEGEVVQVFAPTALDGARVESLKVVQGERVRQGTVIAVLDTYARRQAALKEAQQAGAVAVAGLQQVAAGAKLGQIQAQTHVVDRLQAELRTETMAQAATMGRLEAELAYAQLEDRRYQELYETGAIAASLRDNKHLLADTVRESLSEARALLDRIRSTKQQQIAEATATLEQIVEVRPVDLALARAQVAQAQAAVLRAQAELALAVVRAPQAGQVLKIHTRPGELVGNQGVINLGQTERMVAVAEVYELDVNRVRLGQSATVTSPNQAFTTVLKGTVSEVGLEISKQDVLNTDPAAQFDARVVEVKVRLNPESSRRVAGLTNLSIQVVIDVNN